MAQIDLHNRARKWLKNTKQYSTVVKRADLSNKLERPDVIGWKHGRSLIIMCAPTREHFDAVKKRLSACDPGWGNLRFWMCRPNIVIPGELAINWGLLEVYSSCVRVVHEAIFVPLPSVILNERDLLVPLVRQREGQIKRQARQFTATAQLKDRIEWLRNRLDDCEATHVSPHQHYLVEERRDEHLRHLKKANGRIEQLLAERERGPEDFKAVLELLRRFLSYKLGRQEEG